MSVIDIADIGPPDRWICRTCGFALTEAILRAEDGAVGIDTRPVFDVCPNDGSSLQQITWKEDAADANRVGLEQMKRADALTEALARMPEWDANYTCGVCRGSNLRATGHKDGCLSEHVRAYTDVDGVRRKRRTDE